jgi:hypothetical protein
VLIFIIHVHHSRTELPLWIRDGVERVRGVHFHPAPNFHFGSVTVWNAVRGVHFHHTCAPLPHRIDTLHPSRSGAVLRWCVVLIFIINVRHSRTELLHCIALGALRCSGACMVLIFSFPGPGSPWLFLACSWLLLAAPGCSWLLLGCSWLLMAALGCHWLLLVMLLVTPNVD